MTENIAAKLLQINAIKLNPDQPFTWASGMRSPIYCDNRIVLSYPEIRNAVIDGFVKLANSMPDFNLIAGVATAGIAHGALLADRLGLPFIYVRSSAKKHGRQNKIEGQIPPNAKALVIEDLISTGGSVLDAIDTLKENECNISGVLAIFTYELEIAQKAFEQKTYPLQTISSYSKLIKEAIQSGFITEEEANLLQTWNQDPQQWSENYQNKHR